MRILCVLNSIFKFHAVPIVGIGTLFTLRLINIEISGVNNL